MFDDIIGKKEEIKEPEQANLFENDIWDTGENDSNTWSVFDTPAKDKIWNAHNKP
jgi:hypothetical protein